MEIKCEKTKDLKTISLYGATDVLGLLKATDALDIVITIDGTVYLMKCCGNDTGCTESILTKLKGMQKGKIDLGRCDEIIFDEFERELAITLGNDSYLHLKIAESTSKHYIKISH